MAKPVVLERAVVHEKPVKIERAVSAENPMTPKRAARDESPDANERAVWSEKPVVVERAAKREKPVALERAAVSEKPVSLERAETTDHYDMRGASYMTTLEPLSRMTRDIRAAAATLSDDEARWLVDTYYDIQSNRIRDNARVRELSKTGEPHSIMIWLAGGNAMLEQQIKGALGKFIEAHPLGPWLLETRGVGPVIAAGMVAHIDIRRAQSPSAVWRFAGLDPTAEWKKGQKRPHNAALKRLCWLLGESFVKVGKGPYNELYASRKALETQRNERGDNAQRAAEQLAAKNYSKGTEARKALEDGKLPLAQIHLRAQRYAVKIFLAHLWQEWREIEGLPTASPWVIQHGGHVHMIERFHSRVAA